MHFLTQMQVAQIIPEWIIEGIVSLSLVISQESIDIKGQYTD